MNHGVEDPGQRIKQLLQVASDGIHILDRQGFLIEGSDYFFALLGYSRAEAIGMHVSQWDAQWTREEVMNVIDLNFQLGEGTHRTFESLHRCKDGRIVPVEITARSYHAVLGEPLLYCSSRDISERRQFEATLRFKQFGIDHAAEQMLWIDRQGRILDVNESACRQLGYSYSELVQMSVGDSDPFFTPDQWGRLWEKLKVHGTMSLESSQRHRDGSIFPTEVLANYFEYEGVEYNCMLVRDISRRKAYEQRIQRLTDLYHALSEINQAIVRMETKDKLFPLVCKVAVEFAGFEMAWIGVPSEQRDAIIPEVFYGTGTDYLTGLSFPLMTTDAEQLGPIALSFREARNIFVNDFMSDPLTTPWKARAQMYGWRSGATFPIIQGDTVVAVMAVYAVTTDAFHEEAVTVLDEMVRDIAFALDTFDRELARKKAEQSLYEREQHFRAYFERSMVGMATTASDRRWIEVNPALCEMLGYSNAELTGMSWEDITYTEDLALNRQLFERVVSGKLDEYEFDKRFFKKNGDIIYTHVAARAVRNPSGMLDYLVVLVDDLTLLRKQQLELERRVYYDTLTNLPNRALLTDRLEHALAQLKRSNGLVAVCFIDLDGFKQVNDTYGHALGDHLLVAVGKRIHDACRTTDTVARFGGDEFVVIIEGNSDQSECLFLLQRIQETIGQPFQIEGHWLKISASIGVTLCPDDVSDGEVLLRHADQAMYLAKQSGRDKIYFFDAQSEHLMRHRIHTLVRLEQALALGELQLYYQPKVDMLQGRVIGLEALIRWHDSMQGRLVLPGEFIPLVEGSHFEIVLSEWVVRQALCQLSEWHRMGLDLSLSVNIPAPHLRSPGFVDFIRLEMAVYPQLPPRALELEILETAALGDLDAVIQKMMHCMDFGVSFSIDDFGTGYASLSYLRRLPASIIKIDQVFIRDMLHDPEDLSIVQGVIGLALAFHKAVLAEGVETIAHGRKLLDMGCSLAQGFGIARPMPAAEVPGWIRNFKGFPEESSQQ
ncbi:sensor domain-containing protein [Ferrovum myxofaciens]|uniref:sensor domain-containing protein n=1 Tax=Ferrovum myxofaciens TaxID=416213 RepID=UPI003EBA0B8F